MVLSGQLSPATLGTLAGTAQQVVRALVPQTDALRAAFAARFGKPLVVTDSYRPYAEQVAVFTTRYVQARTGGGYYGDIRWWNGARYVRKRGYAAAAVPGTSNHGWGQALDLGSGVNSSLTSPEYLWMRANAPAYGWTHPAWARVSSSLEPWHWEALPTPVSFPGENRPDIDVPVIAPEPPPIAPILEELMAETRAVLRNAQSGQHYLLDLDEYTVQLLDPDRARLIADLHDVEVRDWTAVDITYVLDVVNAQRRVNHGPVT